MTCCANAMATEPRDALRLVARVTGGGISGAHHKTTVGPGVSLPMFPGKSVLFKQIFIFFRWSEEGAWLRGMHSYSSLPRSRYSSVAKREIDLGPLHRVWYKK